MRFSALLAAAATLVVVATGRVVDLSSQSANVSESQIGTSDESNGVPHVNRLQARGYFDPAKFADEAMWKKYLDKGHHLKCIMEAPDQAAGQLEMDTRTPPSAASKWTGDLTGS